MVDKTCQKYNNDNFKQVDRDIIFMNKEKNSVAVIWEKSKY